MKPHTYLFLVCLLGAALLLAACGPKNVGEDVPKAEEGFTNAANEPEAQLRYPLSGRRLDQRLYHMNQPQIMEERQQRQRDYFDRRTGAPGQNAVPALVPRQASPFRF